MSDFKGRHFRGEIVLWAVRWYCRYPISYRDLEAMMTERGVAVDHSTIYRWVQRFAPEMEKRLRWQWRRPQSRSWRVDETYIKVRGKWAYRTPPVKTAPPVGCIRHDFGDRRLAGGVVVGSWRAARGRRLCGQGLLPVGLPVPGEKLVQMGLRQIGDTVEDIGEPGLRIDVVELRGADERVHDSGPHAPAVGAGEEPRFASETDAAQRPLGGVMPMLA